MLLCQCVRQGIDLFLDRYCTEQGVGKFSSSTDLICHMVLYLDSVGNVTDLICHKVQAELFILTLLFETISVYELIMLLYRASVQLIRFVII